MPTSPSILPPDDPVSFPSMPTLRVGGASLPGEQVLDSDGSMPTLRGRTTPRGERLRVGDVLLGRYTVLSELGQGGMGVVYKCLDNVGGIEVALKCLPPELSRDETEMEGIRENYAIVARLHHSAISGLRQLEKDPGFDEYYLVMDLAEGEDLSQILRRRRGAPMPSQEALAILRPLASALDYAHAEKVLHRDVKPANVKVQRSDGPTVQRSDSSPVRPSDPSTVRPSDCPTNFRVQLLDFGLAAEVRSSMSRVSLRGHAGTSGTPAYMAPEQWEARPQSAATDQYALGVVAYQMLAGHLPFDAEDADLLRRAVLSRAPDPVPGLPRAANAALQRALAKDPAARFPSCGAFVDALARGMQGGWLAGTARPTTRRVGVAAALAVLGLAAMWYTQSGSRRAEPLSPPASAPESHTDSTDSTDTSRTAAAQLDAKTLSPPVSAPESHTDNTDRTDDPRTAAAQLDAGTLSPPVSAPESHTDSTDSTDTPRTGAAQLDAGTSPALPPDDAPLADLEDALARLEARRDSLAKEGYDASDLERAPVEEAIATLETRIEKALAEQTEKAREEALAGRRAEAQRKADLTALQDLKRAVERRVSSLDATWTDGEFARKRAAIADAQKKLAACTDAASLPRAKELRGDIYDAADWIERNTPARAGLVENEKALDALARDCAAASAGKLAAAALRKAERARKDAEKERDEARYEDAAAGYATARDLFEKALSEARAANASAEIESARAFHDAKLWAECLAAAEKALEWEPGNKEATELKAEAEKNLKPEEHTGPKPGEVFPLDLGDGVTLEMVPCPGDKQDFWMGMYEVTEEQWQRVMGSNPSVFKDNPKNPVVLVSWNDCQEFVEKLNSLTTAKASGLTFRLPTEQEWETACRAGSIGDYCKLADGTQITKSNLSRVAWFAKKLDDGPTEVGKNREPNAWGLYDMHGNVWEWTSTAVDDYRVYRGGSFYDTADYCAAGYRGRFSPYGGGRNLGFRLAASGRTAATGYTPSKNDSAVPQNNDTQASNAENDKHTVGERKVVKIGDVEVALRWCPPDSFMMGSPSNEKDRDNDETQHSVTLTKGFWMGETEVTQALWREVTGRNPSYNSKGGSYPVEQVSWNDCMQFVGELNERAEVKVAALRFALPTEAQWEYACRAGGTGDYGKTKDREVGRLEDMGWYNGNSGHATHSATEPRTPNAWGLLNMHGNVWEWCANVYGDHPDGTLDNDAAVRASGARVLRGGGFWYAPRYCRSAYRRRLNPDDRAESLGFRLVASGRTTATSDTPSQNDSAVSQNKDTQAPNAGNAQHKAGEEARFAAVLKKHEHDRVQLWAGGPYWATRNIGAEKPEDYGLYFWWGDTVGYRREGDVWVASDGSSRNFSFSQENKPTSGKDDATLRREGWTTPTGVLASAHDAAQAHWGGNWRMPTRQEISDLDNNCDWTWTTRNGVNGYVVRGRGGYASASIFLPATGFSGETSLFGAGSYGFYWSSIPYSDSDYSWYLYFCSDVRAVIGNYRYYGLSVRPVQGFTE